MPPRDDSAAYASNWRVVLAADAAIGAAVSLAGVALIFAVNLALGASVITIGAMYAAAVGVRARRWSRLRRNQPR